MIDPSELVAAHRTLRRVAGVVMDSPPVDAALWGHLIEAARQLAIATDWMSLRDPAYHSAWETMVQE